MPYLIDAHEDLAVNILGFNRDYRRSAAETRRLETDTPNAERNDGEATLGWPDYQQGQVAMVFATLFISPRRLAKDWDTQAYKNPSEARRLHEAQLDAYLRLCDDAPDKFRLVRSQSELRTALEPWKTSPANYPQTTHPVGLMMTMEGAEGVESVDDLEYWWERGIRLIGPVWGGGRYCGSNREPGPVTSEGRQFMERMAELGLILDLAHMSEQTILQVLDFYPGVIAATHANARALVKGSTSQRLFSDECIARLVERDAVMGVVPFNVFLVLNWKNTDSRDNVPLALIADQIDHICQIAGDAKHAAIGTDFDGGFGWPNIPAELDTIADMPKLIPILQARGYNDDDIAAIFHGNWERTLERSLPV
ncbi:MAG TPA: membrane dipeptidase [Longilinea sp.]|nr:membrane dipeptidase [Longilinea sp.]